MTGDLLQAIPETILVVDDDPGTALFYEKLFRYRGYKVLSAHTGKEALSLASGAAPDLVLLDLVLPDLPGLEVCKRLRRLPQGGLLPIVVVSGRSDREGLLAVLNQGANDFLRKPVDTDELLARVESHLRARHARERYSRVFESLGDALFITDHSGTIRDANRAACELISASPADLAGRPLDRYLRSRAGSVLNDIRRAWETGEPSEPAGCDCPGPQGQSRPCSVFLRCLSGVSTEVLVTVVDRGAQQLVEAELARTRELLESLIRHSVLGVIVADAGGVIRIFNESAERISGYKSSQVIGTLNLSEFYVPGVASDILRKARSGQYGGQGRLEPCVNAVRSSSGEEIPVMLSCSLLLDEQGREVASLALFEDMRERIRIEREMAATRDRAQEQKVREAVLSLAGTASHELSQPLTAILGSTQILLQKHGRDPELSRLLGRIQVASERMGRVIQDMAEVKELRQRNYAGSTTILDLEKSGEK